MAIAKNTHSQQQQRIWGFFKKFFIGIWQIILFIARLIVKILVGLYLLIKSIAFSVSALVASFSLLIIAVSLSIYLISTGLGLKDSSAFMIFRDEVLQKHQEYYQEQQARYLNRKLSTKEYSVAEVSEQSCSSDADCTTPADYLIRSVCPYTSKCLQEKCAVVCPKPSMSPIGILKK